MTDTKDEIDLVETGSLDDKTKPVLDHSDVDPVYQAKAHVLNNAVQQIGMGRYQWELVSKRPLARVERTAGLYPLPRYLAFGVTCSSKLLDWNDPWLQARSLISMT